MENNNLNLSNPEGSSYPVILGNKRLISALFKNPEAAEIIYNELLKQGYKAEDITLVMSENTRNTYFPNTNEHTTAADLGNKTLEGLGVGATLGGSVGAIAAALAAVGTSLVIPALGVVVAGSLAAGFAGAGAGAAAGGLIGALVGSEVPDDQVQLFEEGVKQGGVVIAVNANSDAERDKLSKQWNEVHQNETLNLNQSL